MELPAPFAWHGDHVGIELPGGRALFTTRRGGVSQGAYASLNLGRWTDDDPRAVHENRDRIAADIGVQRSGIAQGRQVHGAEVRRVLAPPDPDGPLTDADGQATALRDVATLVLTADCLPVALISPHAVAIVHAGWRGLAGGVLAEGVAAVRELGGGDSASAAEPTAAGAEPTAAGAEPTAAGADPATAPEQPIAAAIGPAIGGCCFEVGDEVRAAFAQHGDGVRNGDNLDLKAIARAELHAAGVAEVHDVGLCTYCSDPQLFFSHRRDAGVTGRQAGIAWRA